jgi:invasion protein IalB
MRAGRARSCPLATGVSGRLESRVQAEIGDVMRKVLIGVASAIVLGGVVFAIVHFAFGPASFQAQNGWVPVTGVPKHQHGPVRIAATFGAWRLICRNLKPGETAKPALPHVTINNLSFTGVSQPRSAAAGRCALALVMRNPNARREFLSFRLQNLTTGSGTIMQVAYSRQNKPKKVGPQAVAVNVRTDAHTLALGDLMCGPQGVCFTMTELAPDELSSVLSASTIEVLLPPQPGETDEISVPTDGLKAAFSALGRQPE